ncbi:hypothetical protein Pcinc_027616, partial [Petrolisthes cinctipes]
PQIHLSHSSLSRPLPRLADTALSTSHAYIAAPHPFVPQTSTD